MYLQSFYEYELTYESLYKLIRDNYHAYYAIQLNKKLTFTFEVLKDLDTQTLQKIAQTIGD